jgi:NAD(P)H dehydrogenase (quinone)
MRAARVVVAYHSGGGHTRQQAEAVARGARTVPGVEVALRSVDPLTDELWDQLAAADAIVFGSPTYMGTVSAPFKAFADATSRVWQDGLQWRDKVAAGFTNSMNINGDKLSTLQYLSVLAGQHGMHWVNLGLYPGWNTSTASADDLNRLGSFLGAMAQSNGDEDPDVAPPASDLRTAEHLGARVAEVTVQYLRGRFGLGSVLADGLPRAGATGAEATGAEAAGAEAAGAEAAGAEAAGAEAAGAEAAGAGATQVGATR